MATLQKTIDTLRDDDMPLTAEAIRNLSDISNAEMLVLASQWASIPVDRRLKLVTRLGELAETNYELNFSTVTRHALGDQDDEVRREAVIALWYDDDPVLLRRFVELAESDNSDEVRAEALTAIGRFLLLGEHGKIPMAVVRPAQDLAIRIYNDIDEPLEVRRRAIETLGNCTREGVPELIQEAYEADDLKMRASAVHAMGRSYDQDWGEIILDELLNEEPEMRYEAARAAGELELEEAIPTLGQLLMDEDREVTENAIWALGEIGGDAARRLLEDVLERAEIMDDTELLEAIEEALDSSSLVGRDLEFD